MCPFPDHLLHWPGGTTPGSLRAEPGRCWPGGVLPRSGLPVTASIDTERSRIGIYFRDPAVIFCDPGHIRPQPITPRGSCCGAASDLAERAWCMPRFRVLPG